MKQTTRKIQPHLLRKINKMDEKPPESPKWPKARNIYEASLDPENEDPKPEYVEGNHLHLGCGTDYMPGWINVDIRPDVKADLHCYIEDLKPYIRPNSIIGLQATNVLEHISHLKTKEILRMLFSFMVDDGYIHIKGPDLKKQAELYLERH